MLLKTAKFSQAGQAMVGPNTWQQGPVSLQGPAQCPRQLPSLWAYKAGLPALKWWSLYSGLPANPSDFGEPPAQPPPLQADTEAICHVTSGLVSPCPEPSLASL